MKYQLAFGGSEGKPLWDILRAAMDKKTRRHVMGVSNWVQE